jgi:hypothetical protein
MSQLNYYYTRRAHADSIYKNSRVCILYTRVYIKAADEKIHTASGLNERRVWSKIYIYTCVCGGDPDASRE